MGNACYFDNKFSDIIQTRQYRSPEVLIRADYDWSADLWSLACTLFELATGDYLFEPRKGKHYKKNEDHLALISELIGECPDKDFLLSGYRSDKFFDKNGKLLNIKKLKFWKLEDVLTEKYRFRYLEAKGFADFCLQILKWQPKDRPTAEQMLNHWWLKMEDRDDTVMNRREHREYLKTMGYHVSSSRKSSDKISDKAEINQESKD